MITAKEAKEMMALGASNVKRYMDQIDKEIRKCIDDDKSEYVCYVPELWGTKETFYFDNPMSAMQARIKKELTNLGFAVTYGVHGTSYVPRGLQDDDGNGQGHINWCLFIRW